MIYILYYLPSLIIHSLPIKIGFKKFLLILLSSILAFISFSRGNIGTDTANYESLIASVYQINSINLEPLFTIYALITNYLNIDATISTRIISLIIFIQIIFYAKNSTKGQLFLLSYLIIPVFSLSFSTNILRAGVACMFFALFLQNGSKKLIPLSIISQYSSLILFITNYLINKKLNFKYISIFTIFMTLFSASNIDYIITKFELYRNYAAEGIFSGSGILIPILLLLASIFFNKINEKTKRLFLIYFIASISCFLLSQFSYAFIRALSLLHFSLPLIYIKILEDDNISLKKSQKIIIIVSCFIACIFSIKNLHESNYFPYETFY